MYEETLSARLGSGGFATVWEAWDREEEHPVALKVLHGQYSRDESRVERFFRGAREMHRLQHAGIVQVLEPKGVDDGHYYFVMELLEGGDLGRAFKAGEMAADKVLDLVEDVACALASAHVAGVVHRDVKPENILLTKAGLPKLSDFDLVKAQHSTGGTRTGVAAGTPLYAAPECTEDAKDAEASADVYGLAMTATVGLLRKRPSMQLKYAPSALVARLEGLPAPVREVLEASLSIKPEGRPQDAGAFAERLAEARRQPPSPPPEPWADRTGEDEYGHWVEVDIEGVTLRMRWCPPGTFLMGSPRNDTEANDNEYPQHEVTLTEGYWMAETPCTQALWQAVTDTNPSRFRGPKRPVEKVSWDDVARFIEQANARMPGLDLHLPTEAQWEHACRAGTRTPRYGELEDVAWFRPNSGGETRPVREKMPNAWGLYDTLGNVWEWCSDGAAGWPRPDAYEDGPVTDPEAPRGERPARVFRGGSWLDGARRCRAAFRGAGHREDAGGHLGFRVARGRAQGGTKPAEPAPATPAGPRGTSEPEPRGAAGSIVRLPVDLRTSPAPQADLPASLLRPPPSRPSWASEYGDDKFGWFAGVTIENGRRSASFRMRWCPPGTFMMGSPKNDREAMLSERPQHQVTLSEGFWMGETPCTQALWQVATGANPSGFKGAPRPVEQVSWDDVQSFLRRLNAQLPGFAASLPTETQWEYACRAGSTAPRYGKLEDVAWFRGNSGRRTHPVAEKAPNVWGLYDTLGNVWEWCHDLYGPYAEGHAYDPIGLHVGTKRVLRGGSWDLAAQRVRAAYRGAFGPSGRNPHFGFRLSRGHSAPSK